MALDGHVAGGVVTVIVVETNREIAVELLHAVLAHEVHAFLADECAEVDVQSLASDLHQHADLHRYEVEHPGRVPHVVRQVTEFLHVGTGISPTVRRCPRTSRKASSRCS